MKAYTFKIGEFGERSFVLESNALREIEKLVDDLANKVVALNEARQENEALANMNRKHQNTIQTTAIKNLDHALTIERLEKEVVRWKEVAEEAAVCSTKAGACAIVEKALSDETSYYSITPKR